MNSINGFTYAGIDNAGLYKKHNTLIDHITPKIAPSSMTCCSDR